MKAFSFTSLAVVDTQGHGKKLIRWIAVVSTMLVLASVKSGYAALVLNGGGLVLVEQSGTFAAGNLSAGQGQVATPSLAAGTHSIPGLNDVTYGNASSWIADAPNGNGDRFAGVTFGATLNSVQSIAFGRDNLGGFGDRTLGLYTLQYTQVANPESNLNLANNANPTLGWTNIGTLNYVSAGGFQFGSPSLRHRYNFDPVSATAVRLVTSAVGTAIDEIELYSSAGVVPGSTTLALGQSTLVDESTAMSPFCCANGFSGATPEPGGEGSYRYINPANQTVGTTVEFEFAPRVYGENMTVEVSWGANFNHSQDVDYFFDPDGAGDMPEIALLQNVDQTLLADQLTPGGNVPVEWSGFLTIGSGLDITGSSVFRVVSTNVVGGSNPQALTSGVWQFTSVSAPEPSTIVLLGLGIVAFATRRRRTAGQR